MSIEFLLMCLVQMKKTQATIFTVDSALSGRAVLIAIFARHLVTFNQSNRILRVEGNGNDEAPTLTMVSMICWTWEETFRRIRTSKIFHPFVLFMCHPVCGQFKTTLEKCRLSHLFANCAMSFLPSPYGPNNLNGHLQA